MPTVRETVRRLLGLPVHEDPRPIMTANVREVLEGNRMAREGRVVTRHAPWGEHRCRIPLERLPELNKKFPGFDGKSGTQAHIDAMNAFHASPLSAEYDVRKNHPATIKNRPRGIIIRPPPVRREEE